MAYGRHSPFTRAAVKAAGAVATLATIHLTAAQLQLRVTDLVEVRAPPQDCIAEVVQLLAPHPVVIAQLEGAEQPA